MNKQDLLASARPPVAYLTVPEWNGATVRLRGFMLADRISWNGAFRDALKSEDHNALEDLAIKLVQQTLTNEDGSPMFEGDEGRAELAELEAQGFMRVVRRARELCGLIDAAPSGDAPSGN